MNFTAYFDYEIQHGEEYIDLEVTYSHEYGEIFLESAAYDGAEYDLSPDQYTALLAACYDRLEEDHSDAMADRADYLNDMRLEAML